MDHEQKNKIKKFSIKEYALNKEKLGSLTFDDDPVQNIFSNIPNIKKHNIL